MNVNVIIALDTRRKKKDGTYPIILRLSCDERTLPIPTKYSVPLNDWDDKKREVKNSYKGLTSVTRLNNILSEQKKDARDIVLKLQEAGKLDSMSLADVKVRIVKQSASASFITYADEQVSALQEARRFGTARWYATTISVLKDFVNGITYKNTGKSKNNARELYTGKDIKFEDINYKFLTKFETTHYKNGNTVNGLSLYMRAIRAIYNKAIKDGLIDKEGYPFDDYKIKTEPTVKRALDWDLLKKIITLELDATHECFYARNYFVASYMMYGMNFSDMAYLEKSAVTGGRINYRRRKTGKLYDIKITPALEKILSYYAALSPNSPYVFPILKHDTPEQQDKEIQWARTRYNKKLKKLAELCGISQNLTTYVSRHSFATQAMLHEIPLNAISSMMGHSSLKTTEVYLKSLPSNILDDYNAKLVEGI
jgi:integrase/recombinase XerD